MEPSSVIDVAGLLYKNFWAVFTTLATLVLFGLAVRQVFRWYKALKQAATDLVDERLPSAVKKSLQNGSGDIVRAIVHEANTAQMEHVREAIYSALREHEVREERAMSEALKKVQDCERGDCEKVLSALTRHDQRLNDMEALVKRRSSRTIQKRK